MKQWHITNEEAGQRVDQWLASSANMSRKQAKSLLDGRCVSVNGKVVTIAKWALAAGDRVTVKARASHAQRERSIRSERLEVMFENRDIIAVVKSPGMLVVPTEESNEATVVDHVRTYLGRKFPGSGGSYVRALHRLDKDTSGIVVLAKSHLGERVIKQFKRHTITREYLAIVHGRVENFAGTVNLPLSKGDYGHGRKVMPANDEDGKRAITHYEVIERYGNATYVRIRVETGRTHQIRVHMASLGHPLLGDRRYGPPEDPLPVPRLALHASRLHFRPPGEKKKQDLNLPLPEDLQGLIDDLRMSV